MRKQKSDSILKEYERNLTLNEQFTQKITDLVKELLNNRKLKVHSVTSRVKTEESLKNKLLSSEGKYESLRDITDISGIRIITYFEDEVDQIANVIKEEFEINVENSIDTRALLDPDKFGYLSAHYVVKLHPNRLRLTEYKRFSDCKAEIQIRSILQHAWAEIEHDAGYKSKQEVPREIRRKFSRLAGLLELADEEFKLIRNDLRRYEKEVSDLINTRSDMISVDKTSLTVFVRENVTLRKIDEDIVSNAGAELKYNQGFVDGMVAKIGWFDIKTINVVERHLEKYGDLIIKLAGKIIIKDKYDLLSAGIGLFYLCYILLLREPSKERIVKYLNECSIGPAENSIQIAEKILANYTEVTKE